MPGAFTMRSARKASEGLVTSTMPSFAHLENPHLGGGAKAVLDRPQQPVGLKTVALQVEDGIDNVLQHPRPGDRAFLGDVPHQENRDAPGFRQLT